MKSLFRFAISILLPTCLGLLNNAGQAADLVRPTPKIRSAIRESQLAETQGGVHPLARAEFDQGAAPDSLEMDRMLLVLKRSPEQEATLKQLIKEQNDPASANYGKWLTPAEFGAHFGAAPEDIQIITAWLQSHGFIVEPISNGRSVIEFSGNAGQVNQAFHTAIHRYALNREMHWANASNPKIPQALADVVVGVASLHNFAPKPQHVFSKQPIVSSPVAGSIVPNTHLTSGNNALSPRDFRVIYGLTPLSADGTGTTIAVVGRSNINVQDIEDFSALFSLPTKTPQVILNGRDPGIVNSEEETEALLDATWSAAVAPGATVKLVVSASTNTTDGILLSEQYIINNNLADVMTESFSTCEAHASNAAANFIESMAQQAAAQGIAYVVSTGDSGAAGCDKSSSTTATQGASVNLLASTPYNVAVGGTQFDENGTNSLYWSSSNDFQYESAYKYIPEVTWNESGTSGLWSSGGGKSRFFSKPDWQTGVTGIPADGARDLPDVALNSAANHDPYILCLHGSCKKDSAGHFSFYQVGGTSAAAPAFAGILAVLTQNQGRRLGQANYLLYSIASHQDGSCTESTCVFHDAASGNNSVPGLTGYQAGAGYDLTTGLGSVDAYQLSQAAATSLISLKPDHTSATFTAQSVGVLSSPTAITVRSGAYPVAFPNFPLSGPASGDFVVTSTCAPQLSANSSCTIWVTFTPKASGSRTATLTLPDGTKIALSGTGSGSGLFEIVSVATGKVLDDTGASYDRGTVMQQWDPWGGHNQRWTFIPVDGGAYVEIVNALSGKVLDVTNNSPSPGALIQQWDYLGGDNQKWQLVPLGDGSFKIVSKMSGKVLDVRNVSTANGAVIQQWDYLGGNNQKWQINPIQYYEIQSNLSGMALDVTNYSVVDGAPIQQWSYLGGDNQKWQLIPVEDNYYRIVSKLSGKSLDDTNYSRYNGALVQQWDFLDGDNQKWRLDPVDSTSFKIVNKLSGKVLDVTGYSSNTGAQIQEWDYLGGANQQWKLIPAP